MKIKFIYPEWGHFPLIYRRYIPVMGPAILFALTPSDIEISFTDERLEVVDTSEDCDLVAISMMSCQANRAYELSRVFRSRGIPVVLGGVHVSLMPEEALENADAVVVGEAEDTWPMLIKDFRKGRLRKMYVCQKPPENIPLPMWDFFDSGVYLPLNSLQVSRGCPVNCELCSVPQAFGTDFRIDSVEKLLNEVRQLGKFVFIINDNLHLAKRRIKSFFEGMAEIKKQWIGLAPLSVAEDEKYLKLLKKSNCWALYIDLSPWISASLTGIVDSTQLKKAEEYINRVRNNGIKVIASFVFGFDHDTKDIFEKTVAFAKNNKIEEVEFHILTPYPKSRLFEKLIKEKRLLTFDLSRYSTSSVVFEPKNMKPDELYEGYLRAWKEFYPHENYDDTEQGPVIKSFAGFPLIKGDNLLNYKGGKWVEAVIKKNHVKKI